MASMNKRVADFEGLVPALDRRKLTKPFIVEGKNFIVDANGPKTVFGSRFVTPQVIKAPANAESIKVGNETFYFFATGIFKLGETSKIFYLIHAYSVGDISASPHRWTHAEVNTVHFFCHPAVGVLYLDSADEQIKAHPGTNLPTTPTAICEAGGRLVILGTDFYGWSEQDNGLSTTLSLATGAGQQALSIVGGTPITVTPITAGFMVFTTEGAVAAKLNFQMTVFTHDVAEFDHRPINSFCVMERHSGEALFLSKLGLFTTRGGEPKAYLPLYSEFLRDELLDFDYEDTTRIRIDHISNLECIAVSFGPNGYTSYTHAYFIHETTERIGSYNHGHYAFMESYFQTGANTGKHFTCLDLNGRLIRNIGVPSREVYPSSGLEYYHKAEQEFPIRFDGSSYIMADVMRMTALNEASFRNNETTQFVIKADYLYPEVFTEAPQPADGIGAEFGEDWNNGTGAEDWSILTGSIDWAATPDIYMPYAMSMRQDLYKTIWYSPTLSFGALESEVQIGLFRFAERSVDAQQYPDELSLVTDLVIGTGLTGNLADDLIDYMTIPEGSFDEDWDSLTGAEDWGYGNIDFADYTVNMIASSDGTEQFNNVVPTLSRQLETQRNYTLLSTGVYHNVHVQANSVGQSFHLKELEVAGSMAGRL